MTRTSTKKRLLRLGYLHLKPNFRIGGSYFSARATDDTDREIFGPVHPLASASRWR